MVVIRNNSFPYIPQEGYEKKATDQSGQYPFSFHFIYILEGEVVTLFLWVYLYASYRLMGKFTIT